MRKFAAPDAATPGVVINMDKIFSGNNSAGI